jgi:hypothetical protein
MIQEGGKDKREIPTGLFKPHMTFMLSGKTGSGKSTALLNMVNSYTDNDVFQKIVVISPTVQFDEKFKILPLTEVYEEYSDELLGQIMEQQKEEADLARADLTGELTSHRLISLAGGSRIGRPTQTGLSSLDPRSGCSIASIWILELELKY